MSFTRKPVADDGLHVAPHSTLEASRDGLEPVNPHTLHQQYPQHYPQHYPPNSPQSNYKQEAYEHAPPRQERKRLCGIPALAFWLLLALIVALAAAVAVVGGVLGSRHTSPPTQTPTATVTAPPTTVTTTASAVSATGGFDCTQNGTVFTSSTGATFKTVCDVDLGVGKTWNNTDVDLIEVIVDSYGACIDACALTRVEGLEWTHASGACVAVVWISAGSGKGACWMKNGTGKAHYNPEIQAALLLQG